MRAKSALEMFHANYMPEPNSGCWLWTGATNVPKDYGVMQRKEFKGYAHRYSYITFRGAIPRGMLVLHRCDTPSCVNPAHLFLGTQFDNMRDCVLKGRHASQNPKTSYARGVRHPNAKLNPDLVRQIRLLNGTMTRLAIATRVGVSKSAVNFVLADKTWTHVGDDT